MSGTTTNVTDLREERKIEMDGGTDGVRDVIGRSNPTEQLIYTSKVQCRSPPMTTHTFPLCRRGDQRKEFSINY